MTGRPLLPLALDDRNRQRAGRAEDGLLGLPVCCSTTNCSFTFHALPARCAYQLLLNCLLAGVSYLIRQRTGRKSIGCGRWRMAWRRSWCCCLLLPACCACSLSRCPRAAANLIFHLFCCCSAWSPVAASREDGRSHSSGSAILLFVHGMLVVILPGVGDARRLSINVWHLYISCCSCAARR